MFPIFARLWLWVLQLAGEILSGRKTLEIDETMGSKAMKEKTKYNSSMKRYMSWPLFLTALLLVVNALVYMADLRAGIYVSCGVLVYFLTALVLYRIYSGRIIKDLVSFADQYEYLEKRMLEDMAQPYALTGRNGDLIWVNHAFSSFTGTAREWNGNIRTLFPEFSMDILGSIEKGEVRETFLQFDGKLLRAVLECLSVKDVIRDSVILEDTEADTDMVAIYLHDETELRQYMESYENDKMVAGLAYLDNYDEALQSVDEVRRSLLTALIDRKLTRYFSEYDCLVRKMEKDKYFLVLCKRSLEKLEEQKFQILEDVKTVNIGNEMAVTLSIGLGMDGQNYLENYEFCRTAIEMALGRGGDQVVVKKGDKISYYGGKTPQMEKNTRVKARVKAQALQEFIASKDQVVVMGHKITDVDALGAAIGIYRAGKTLGKPVHIVVNDPTTSIKPLMAEFMDNPEYEPTMFIDSVQAKGMVDENTVIVVVDTNKPSYTECQELLELTKTIVVLDHHRRGSEVIENAVLSYVEPYASSTCEMVSEILQYFQDGLKLRNAEADCLYAGIIIDTNNFTTRSGVRTFEAAAFLRRNGADVTRVRKMLRDNFDSYKARAEAVRSSEIYRDCFAIAKCPSEGLESPTVVGAQAANELLNIAGVKASFVLTIYNNTVYISARAIDEVNVQVMMEKMGGGGHLNIAGAQVKASVMEAEEMLKKIIDEAVDEPSGKEEQK